MSNELFSINNIESTLDASMPIFMSYTRSNEDGYIVNARIGISDIEHSSGRTLRHFFNPMISDHDFVHVVLNMYHEQFHCIQKKSVISTAKFG